MRSTEPAGATRIRDTFRSLESAGRRALCPFVCAGYPSGEAITRTLPRLEQAGAAMIELGIPFSDPIADGPIIASAMHDALVRGVTPRNCFDQLRAARQAGLTLPVVLMASVSLIEHAGAQTFARQAAEAGAQGVILPDAPLEESDRYAQAMTAEGLCTSLLVAPTTPDERAVAIARACTGFVYVLTRTGITGTEVDPDQPSPIERLRTRVSLLRGATDLPLACGFGIANPADVRAVVRDADAHGAIVGTAFVRTMGDAASAEMDPAAAAANLAQQLATGTDPV